MQRTSSSNDGDAGMTNAGADFAAVAVAPVVAAAVDDKQCVQGAHVNGAHGTTRVSRIRNQASADRHSCSMPNTGSQVQVIPHSADHQMCMEKRRGYLGS